MSQRASSRPRMTGEIRFRVPLVLLPVLILLAIGLVAFGFSRVLLALEAEVATVIALVSAANLLGAATFMALRPEAARRRWPELLAVVLYPVLIGIAVAQTGYGHVAEEAAASTEEPAGGAAAPADTNTIVAVNTSFETDTLEATAGEEVSYTLDNRDEGVPHNFAVYASEDAVAAGEDALFASPDTTGPESVDFSFTPPEKPGEYPYICDFHPTTMKGTLVVAAAEGASGKTTGGGGKKDGAKERTKEGKTTGGGGNKEGARPGKTRGGGSGDGNTKGDGSGDGNTKGDGSGDGNTKGGGDSKGNG